MSQDSQIERPEESRDSGIRDGSEKAGKEALPGMGDLVQKDKDRAEYLKKGGKSGITDEFGKPLLLDEGADAQPKRAGDPSPVKGDKVGFDATDDEYRPDGMGGGKPGDGSVAISQETEHPHAPPDKSGMAVFDANYDEYKPEKGYIKPYDAGDPAPVKGQKGFPGDLRAGFITQAEETPRLDLAGKVPVDNDEEFPGMDWLGDPENNLRQSTAPELERAKTQSHASARAGGIGGALNLTGDVFSGAQVNDVRPGLAGGPATYTGLEATANLRSAHDQETEGHAHQFTITPDMPGWVEEEELLPVGNDADRSPPEENAAGTPSVEADLLPADAEPYSVATGQSEHPQEGEVAGEDLAGEPEDLAGQPPTALEPQQTGDQEQNEGDIADTPPQAGPASQDADSHQERAQIVETVMFDDANEQEQY